MGKIYIWDRIKNKAELIKRTMETLRAEWSDEVYNDAKKVLDNKDIIETVVSSVLFSHEFFRGIRDITFEMRDVIDLNKAVKKWRNNEKNSFDRCTPADELQAISEGLSEEMKNRLIAEAKAVRTKTGEFILHPLMEEIADEQKGRQR